MGRLGARETALEEARFIPDGSVAQAMFRSEFCAARRRGFPVAGAIEEAAAVTRNRYPDFLPKYEPGLLAPK